MMMNQMILAISVFGLIALAAALLLYWVSKRFAVDEDARLGEVATMLPGANCGGCGFPGCAGMAAALVKGADAGSIDGLQCPVGGADTMTSIATFLGVSASATKPQVAVVRCNGTCALRPKVMTYDGLRTCKSMSLSGRGETACGYGCLGCGDCVDRCTFEAITMDEQTGLPVVDETRCTACGACVEACPRNIIELRDKGPKNRRIYVRCVSQDKGAVARKACEAACIGCGKCEKECKFEAIKVENNVAYIDFNKCRLCRKCELVCPTSAIISVNFPERKPKVAADATLNAAGIE